MEFGKSNNKKLEHFDNLELKEKKILFWIGT